MPSSKSPALNHPLNTIREIPAGRSSQLGDLINGRAVVGCQLRRDLSQLRRRKGEGNKAAADALLASVLAYIGDARLTLDLGEALGRAVDGAVPDGAQYAEAHRFLIWWRDRFIKISKQSLL